MNKSARLLVLFAAGLETGCASFVRGSPVEWSCTNEVVDGDVIGSSYFNVNAKGEPIQDGDEWEWRASDRDFRVSLIHGFFQDEVELFVDIPRAQLRKRLTIELRIGAIDRPQSDRTLIDSRDERLQYNIRLTRSRLKQLEALGQPLYVAGVDRSGTVVRSVRLDTTALARGEAAMAAAKERAAARARNYATMCRPLYQGDPPVIT